MFEEKKHINGNKYNYNLNCLQNVKDVERENLKLVSVGCSFLCLNPTSEHNNNKFDNSGKVWVHLVKVSKQIILISHIFIRICFVHTVQFWMFTLGTCLRIIMSESLC